jgi:hypothetical protein
VQLEGLIELEEPDCLIILDPEVPLASAGLQCPACRHCLAGTDECLGDPIGSIRDDVDAQSALEGELEIAPLAHLLYSARCIHHLLWWCLPEVVEQAWFGK